jgi:hypothetical protein
MSRNRQTPTLAHPGTVDRCPKRYCMERLRIVVQPGGVCEAICDPCDRNARGLCRDCPRKLVFKGNNRGNTFWCAECRARHAEDRKRDRYEATRDEQLKKLRRRWRTDRAYRKKRLEYLTKYRATHPAKKYDDVDRLYKRTWWKNAMKDPNYREKELARRNRKRLAKRRALVLAGKVQRLSVRDRQWLAEAA